MRHAAIVCVMIFFGFQWSLASDERVIESAKAQEDVALATDPADAFWEAARPIYAEKGPQGQSVGRNRTEIRSRWTEKNLYFLFICPYEKLNLKPSPSTSKETFQL